MVESDRAKWRKSKTKQKFDKLHAESLIFADPVSSSVFGVMPILLAPNLDLSPIAESVKSKTPRLLFPPRRHVAEAVRRFKATVPLLPTCSSLICISI